MPFARPDRRWRRIKISLLHPHDICISVGVTARWKRNPDLRKIALFIKKDAQAERKAGELRRWLEDRGVSVVMRQSPSPRQQPAEPITAATEAPADLDCVFVLGGDGTFLSAVRWIGEHPVPLIGVKFGEVGFLAETTEDRLYDTAAAILENRVTISERMRLTVRIRRHHTVVAEEHILNDVVVSKGTLARLSDIATYMDDHYLTTFRADGLIVATPTGSTAYSLAAGGPVLHPAVPGIILTPICPFTLTNRPLIVPDSVCITLRVDEKARDMMLTFDGQAGREITPDDTIDICKAVRPVQMITLPQQQYYDVLKAKLRWSGGRV